MTIDQLTEKQFSGEEEIEGSLYLESLTSIPEGFNPTVGGSLYLGSLTSIPEGFNPTVGGSLDLGSLTSIPEGFNPTVGGYLDLRSLTSIPEGFNRSDYEDQSIPLLEWEDGRYILVDGIFSEVINRRGNVLKVRQIGSDDDTFLVTDGERWAHGETLKEANDDLRFKVMSEDFDKESLVADIKARGTVRVEDYRLLTGACREGCRQFLQSKGVTQEELPIKDVIALTRGAYGSEAFSELLTS